MSTITFDPLTESDTDSMPSASDSDGDNARFLQELEDITNDFGLEPVTSRRRLAKKGIYLPRGILSNIISYACYDWQELRRQHKAVWSGFRVDRQCTNHGEISLVGYNFINPGRVTWAAFNTPVVEVDLGRVARDMYVPWYDAPNRWWVARELPQDLTDEPDEPVDELNRATDEAVRLAQAILQVGILGPIPDDVDPASLNHIAADPPTDESDDEASQWLPGDD